MFLTCENIHNDLAFDFDFDLEGHNEGQKLFFENLHEFLITKKFPLFSNRL